MEDEKKAPEAEEESSEGEKDEQLAGGLSSVYIVRALDSYLIL